MKNQRKQKKSNEQPCKNLAELEMSSGYQKLDLKVGDTGAGEGGSPCTPLVQIQIFVQECPYELSEKVPGCLPVASFEVFPVLGEGFCYI